MKFSTYIVDFGHTEFQLRALNKNAAKILAQAEMIHQGKSYEVISIKEGD